MPKPLFQQIWHGESVELCQRFRPGSVNAIICDPPFGTDNQSNMAVTEAGKKYARKIAHDATPEEAIENFTEVMEVLVPKMSDTGDIYVFTSYQVLSEWLVLTDNLFAKWNFTRRAVLVWEKDGPGMGDLSIPWGMGMEFILFFRRGSMDRRIPRRNATLHYPQLRPQDLIHPHEKPTSILVDFLKASTDERDFAVDPFGGSGSLARAGLQCNRSVISIESDKENAELAQESLARAKEGFF